jgi:endo-1,4-beta-xylanase
MMRLAATGLASLALMIAQPVTASGDAAQYSSALAELRAKLPADAQIINQPGVVSWSVNGSAESKVVPASAISGGKALSVVVIKAQSNPWDISVTAPVTEPISNGDTIFLAVQMRASSADNEAQSGVIAASKIEENGGAFTAIADTAAQVSDQWTTLYSVGIANRDYASRATHITVHLAAARQTIEIGNAYAFNLGRDIDVTQLPKLKINYAGREPDAAWRAPARARIDAIRKGTIELRAVNADGEAVSNARVHIQMTKHKFHFGSFVGHDITRNDPDTQKLRDTFPMLFNTATSPLYWQDWGWQSPKMRAQYMASMKYLADKKSHGVDTR